MFLHFHPTRAEALTVNEATLTRWSLTSPAASVVAHLSTAPYPLLHRVFLPNGRDAIYGGPTGATSDGIFAHRQLREDYPRHTEICRIELRSWDTLAHLETVSLPQIFGDLECLAASPDGRWLVLGSGLQERLFLVDRRTGQVSSQHAVGGYVISGLTFDATSTWLAVMACHDAWGHLMLWKLELADRFLSRSPGDPATVGVSRDDSLPLDQVHGSHALQVLHWELDRTGIEDNPYWHGSHLRNSVAIPIFSPDSRLVMFRLLCSTEKSTDLDLTVYEVATGKRLWWLRTDWSMSSCQAFTPDSQHVLLANSENTLFCYRAWDGELAYQLPSGLSEPIEACGFDHKGSLWLATRETLVAYQEEISEQ